MVFQESETVELKEVVVDDIRKGIFGSSCYRYSNSAYD